MPLDDNVQADERQKKIRMVKEMMGRHDDHDDELPDEPDADDDVTIVVESVSTPPSKPADEGLPDFQFGPVVTPDDQIIGICMIWHRTPIPVRVIDFITETLGDVFLETDNAFIWKLKYPTNFNDDGWRWLHRAISWYVRTNFEIEIAFDERYLKMDDLYGEGPLLDFDGRHSETKALIGSYRKSLAKQAVAAGKEYVKGHQRVLYRTWVEFQDSTLTPTERMTMLAILRHCWSKNKCHVLETDLANDVGCSVRTLQRALVRLAKDKWIAVETRYKIKSTYTVLRKELIPPYVNTKAR